MKIKTYQFKEVMDFLRENPDKEFDYCSSTMKDAPACLMIEFFRSKGFSEGFITYEGNHLTNTHEEPNDNNTLAEVVNGPEKIGTYHCDIYNGKELLEELESAGY